MFSFNSMMQSEEDPDCGNLYELSIKHFFYVNLLFNLFK